MGGTVLPNDDIVVTTDIQRAKVHSGPTGQFGKTSSTEAYEFRHPILPWLVKLTDLLVVVLATALFETLYHPQLMGFRLASLDVAWLVGALVFLLFPKNDKLLKLPRLMDISSQLRYLLPAVVMAGASAFGVMWMLGGSIAGGSANALAWDGYVVSGLVLGRGVGTAVLSRPAMKRRLARRIAVVGSGRQANRIARRFERDGSATFDMVGLFNDNSAVGDNDAGQGSVADLIALSREHSLHSIIIALPMTPDHEERVAGLVWRLRSVLADVYILPYLVHGADMELPIESLGPLSLMVLQRRPLTEWQMLAKTMLDLMIGLAAVMLLLPLLIVVAIAIKLESPGPVLFCQPRLGFNNCHFTVFKFRSMYTNMTDLTAVRQTSRNDPRVTRVGKWLRKLSIDELPQLLNVLRGDMSLVGPRPHAPHTRADGKLLDDALAEYVIRHQVKPGITGWAQVNGARGELVTLDDLRRRVAFDLEYMKLWSIWFDLKILWLTVLREVVSSNAF